MGVHEGPNDEHKKDFNFFPVTAYQCDSNYKKITATITPTNPILRICIEGESANVVCKGILSATLKQSGNGIKEDKIIENGARTTSHKYAEVEKQNQLCKLTTNLRPAYFRKKTSDSKLQLTVEGNADMQNKDRRQLSDADNQYPDKQFQIFVDIGETDTGEEPQSTTSEPQKATTWVMGKEADKTDTATGVYNLAVGAVMIVFMLM